MRIEVPAEILGAQELGPVHFIGIGGAGLSAIARVMLARGVPVSGSDGRDSPTLASLRVAGARIFVGHHAAHLAGARTVVVRQLACPAQRRHARRPHDETGLRMWRLPTISRCQLQADLSIRRPELALHRRQNDTVGHRNSISPCCAHAEPAPCGA